MQQTFTIDKVQLYNRLTGKEAEIMDQVVIKILPYDVYGTTMSAYVEFIDSEGGTVSSQNTSITVPDTWNLDYLVLVRLFAEKMNLSINIE